jgi:hypothetical protein
VLRKVGVFGRLFLDGKRPVRFLPNLFARDGVYLIGM